MNIFRHSKGETLAETIIALSILAIGITIASTIIMNSIRNLSNAKNRVTAVNIAREGIEAMRNIRDTNWLYYSDKRRACWNYDPGNANPCDGTTGQWIQPGVYIIYKDTNQSWKIASADSDLASDGDDLDGIFNNDIDPNYVRLSLVDINDALDSDGDGDNENDFDMYNHKNTTAAPDSLGTETRTTPFSRYITIEYMENVPGGDSSLDPPNDAVNSPNEWTTIVDPGALNRMRITSTVEWVRGAVHKVELSTIITDHLGRESLED